MGTNTATIHPIEQDSATVRPDNTTGHFLSKVGLIIGREYKSYVTRRSFIISTIIIMVALIIGACVPTAIRYFTSSAATAPAEMAAANTTSEQIASYILVYVGIILISMAVFLYGNIVAQGVAEEKGGRIMEILVNAATPFELMTGKILGIGAAGLTQMASLVAVAIGALFLQAPLSIVLFGSAAGSLSLGIAGVSITPLLLLLLYFLLGFLLYATMFAAAGALVRRQDEAQSAATPITMLFMVGYLVSYAAIFIADASWVKVMSYIPFWTPVLMLVRVEMGTVAWWEIVISVILMVAFIVICALLAARIYRYGVLMYGQKPGLRQLLKTLRA